MSRRRLWIFLACGIPLLAAMPSACTAPQPRTTPTSNLSTTTTPNPSTTESTTAPSTALSTAPSTSPTARTAHRREIPPPLLTGLKEGTYLADRLGQFAYNPLGPYSYFYFYQAGHKVEIELLPDRALMAIEQASFWDDHLRFRVSGTVTSYNGRNYLLVQRVTRARPPTQPATARSSIYDVTQPTSQP